MEYQKARPKIKSGDLLAWRGTGILSRFIRRFTMSEYSHVGIAWIADGSVFVIEAREGMGVTNRRVSDALPFDWVESGHRWNKAQRTFAFSKLQKKYSYFDAFLAGIGIRMKNDDKWICSEFAREILRLGGEPIPDDVQTPAELMAHFHKTDRKIQYVREDDAQTDN